MSLCRARLRNTSNALTLRLSSEQILNHGLAYIVRGQQLDPADDQAVNSRLLVQRRKSVRVPEVLRRTRRIDS